MKLDFSLIDMMAHAAIEMDIELIEAIYIGTTYDNEERTVWYAVRHPKPPRIHGLLAEIKSIVVNN